jgi:hypothetical protein
MFSRNPSLPEPKLDVEWARVDRRWWELDREWEALRHRLSGGGPVGDLFVEMNRILQAQEAAIRRMDVLLEGMARRNGREG